MNSTHSSVLGKNLPQQVSILQQPSVLIFSHAFVPAARAGVFRSLRFAENLPQFGWKPLVVMRKPADSLGGADDSLGRLLSPDTVVVQTTVLSPYATVCRNANAFFSRSGLKKATSDTDGSANPTDHVNQHAGNLRRILRSLNRPIEHWLATPDQHVGWVLPAVNAGWSLIRKYRPDVILSTGPPHSSHLAAVFLKRLSGIPVVLDFRDPWTRDEWSKDTRMTAHRRLQCWLERFCVRRAERVILNTPRLRDEFRKFYADESGAKFVAITNGFDLAFYPKVDNATGREESNGNGKSTIRICHPGTIYGRRSLNSLVAAAAHVAREGHNVSIDQIGFVDNQTELMRLVRELDIEQNLQLTPRLPHDQTLQRMSSADILAVIQPGTSIQVPGKLFEMMPFRKPILALTEEGATADIVNKFKLGKVVPSNESETIAAAIVELVGEHSRYPDATGWASAMREFDGRRLTRDLADILDELKKSA